VQSGSLLIDSSTIDPAASQDIEKQAADKGAVYMDSPVSGGRFSRVIHLTCILGTIMIVFLWSWFLGCIECMRCSLLHLVSLSVAQLHLVKGGGSIRPLPNYFGHLLTLQIRTRSCSCILLCDVEY